MNWKERWLWLIEEAKQASGLPKTAIAKRAGFPGPKIYHFTDSPSGLKHQQLMAVAGLAGLRDQAILEDIEREWFLARMKVRGNFAEPIALMLDAIAELPASRQRSLFRDCVAAYVRSIESKREEG